MPSDVDGAGLTCSSMVVISSAGSEAVGTAVCSSFIFRGAVVRFVCSRGAIATLHLSLVILSYVAETLALVVPGNADEVRIWAGYPSKVDLSLLTEDDSETRVDLEHPSCSRIVSSTLKTAQNQFSRMSVSLAVELLIVDEMYHGLVRRRSDPNFALGKCALSICDRRWRRQPLRCKSI